MFGTARRRERERERDSSSQSYGIARRGKEPVVLPGTLREAVLKADCRVTGAMQQESR